MYGDLGVVVSRLVSRLMSRLMPNHAHASDIRKL